MPRLNNQDEKVAKYFGYTINWDDPGENGPVDVCFECYSSGWKHIIIIDHPPYEEMCYNCAECGKRMHSDDNEV